MEEKKERSRIIIRKKLKNTYTQQEKGEQRGRRRRRKRMRMEEEKHLKKAQIASRDVIRIPDRNSQPRDDGGISGHFQFPFHVNMSVL